MLCFQVHKIMLLFVTIKFNVIITVQMFLFWNLWKTKLCILVKSIPFFHECQLWKYYFSVSKKNFCFFGWSRKSCIIFLYKKTKIINFCSNLLQLRSLSRIMQYLLFITRNKLIFSHTESSFFFNGGGRRDRNWLIFICK